MRDPPFWLRCPQLRIGSAGDLPPLCFGFIFNFGNRNEIPVVHFLQETWENHTGQQIGGKELNQFSFRNMYEIEWLYRKAENLKWDI
jgi:hypothetical protein